MDVSEFSEAKQHEIQHLLIVLDQLGKYFGLNRDIYYTLGQYLGYSDTSLLTIESQMILCLGFYVLHVLRWILPISLNLSPI